MNCSGQKRTFQSAIVAVAALLFAFVSASSVSAQAAPATQSTGARIGTIIKDAISTAFPGVSGIGGIIDAIWSKKPNNGNNMNKAQLTTATTQAQPDIKTSIVAQAQKSVASVSEVADELAVLSQFGVPTTTAELDVVRMTSRINVNTQLSNDDLTQLKADWAEIKAELGTVKSADPTKVQDLWLRDKLTKIQQTNITVVLRIDTEMSAKPINLKQLAVDLTQLGETLQDISAAMGYEVSNMQAGLKALSSWANGAAGLEDVVLTPEGQKYKTFLDKSH